jgi:2-dehydropantoate 2-reductase
MKIAVIGAGAMGSLFGALLAEGGHEVWLCDIWQEHIKALKQNGLKIKPNQRLNQPPFWQAETGG